MFRSAHCRTLRSGESGHVTRALSRQLLLQNGEDTGRNALYDIRDIEKQQRFVSGIEENVSV